MKLMLSLQKTSYMENETLSSLIEDKSCKCFNVTRDEIRMSRRKDRAFTDCLHFIWYLRHRIEGCTVKELSSIYGKTQRNIFSAISKIENGVITQPFYINMKSKIMEEMIRGAIENSEAPQEGKKE